MNTTFLPRRKYCFKPSAWWEQFPQSPALLQKEFGVIKYPIDRKLPFDEMLFQQFLGKVKTNKVLEYGVGMGGNLVALGHFFKEVHGYDTPNMIAALKNLAPSFANLSSSFDSISVQQWDAMVDITCWQHMNGPELIYCLQEMSLVVPYALSFTRCYNDPTGLNILKLVGESKAWTIESCSMNIEQAELLRDESHFTVLYKSNFTGSKHR